MGLVDCREPSVTNSDQGCIAGMPLAKARLIEKGENGCGFKLTRLDAYEYVFQQVFVRKKRRDIGLKLLESERSLAVCNGITLAAFRAGGKVFH